MKAYKIKSKIFFIFFPIFYLNSPVITSVISFLCVLPEFFSKQTQVCVCICKFTLHVHLDVIDPKLNIIPFPPLLLHPIISRHADDLLVSKLVIHLPPDFSPLPLPSCPT